MRDDVAWQLQLSAADKAAMEEFAGCATAGEVGGVTLKKFASNAAKKCIVAEYVVGGGGAKKDEAPKGAKEAGKKKAPPAAASAKTATPSAYDNVPGVREQIVQDLLDALKAEGVSLDGKEEKLAAKFSDVVEVPLVALKNTAYTSGIFSWRMPVCVRARPRCVPYHCRVPRSVVGCAHTSVTLCVTPFRLAYSMPINHIYSG
jgi:hypothetical protein